MPWEALADVNPKWNKGTQTCKFVFNLKMSDTCDQGRLQKRSRVSGDGRDSKDKNEDAVQLSKQIVRAACKRSSRGTIQDGVRQGPSQLGKGRGTGMLRRGAEAGRNYSQLQRVYDRIL
eukprot:jgi/Botrbrau1/14283/Bobra.0368s0014.1